MVIGVTLIVFTLIHLTPGDPVEVMMAGQGTVTQQQIDQLRAEMGLDEPLWRQYLLFLGGLARGDIGISFYYRGTSVGSLIASRLPATIELTVMALLISLVIALPVGVLSAVRRYSWPDRVGTVGALLGVSMPDFWLGLVLMIVFAVTLQWLPISGRITYGLEPAHLTGLYLLDSLLTRNGPAFGDALRHLLLPAVTLGAAMAALTMRITRSSMLEVIRQEYITYARAKGLSGARVVLRHVLRNALIPTVTVVTLNVGTLLGGNMIVETIFGWPGLGRLVVDSVYVRDYPVVQAAVFVYALTYILMNLAADSLYTYLNPRVTL
ncbi:peptide ABC transporter permease [Limnochorda pilosa]|uniref:Peptide ABC transporter permease n=1 Tax=Limnochorda pilosa TaxID=1555112 RepID=A0A0K2SJI5_LIMPI|nr:peptide ABC transporter permease [Limnochorda pilosa]